jgi:phosphoribosyl-ATP pyrophosphohydrolase
MVMLSELDLSAQDVLDELAARFGVGGHEEKAGR